MESFLQIGIVGALLSFVVEFIKNHYGTTSIATKGLTVLLSLVLGVGLYFIQGTEIFTAVTGILGMATVVYAYLLK